MKADVAAQHVAWHGALHEITNQVWTPSPYYMPAKGQGLLTMTGRGHYLPYRAFSQDLYKDAHDCLHYG